MQTAKRLESARQRFEAFISKQTDEMLLAAIVHISAKGEAITIDERVARAGLLNEYERRNGGEAVDALMDSLGL